MEEILRKLFLKRVYYDIKDYDESIRSALSEKEIGTLKTDIEKKISMIIDSIEMELEDICSDIKIELEEKLEVDTYMYDDDTCIDDEIKKDYRYKKVVICEKKDCKSNNCVHIKPHIFGKDCLEKCFMGNDTNCIINQKEV